MTVQPQAAGPPAAGISHAPVVGLGSTDDRAADSDRTSGSHASNSHPSNSPAFDSPAFEDGAAAPDRRLVLWTCLAAMFATTFTATVLTVSIRTVADDLHSTTGVIAWSVTGAMFTQAVVMPILGQIGDIRGHRRTFLVGNAVAIVFSAATALAWDPVSLIAFRAVAQLAGAATIPASFAMLFAVYPPRERVRPAAWASGVLSGSSVSGLAIGGLVIDSIGWRPLFLLQACFAAAALFCAIKILPRDPRFSRDVPAPAVGTTVEGTPLEGVAPDGGKTVGAAPLPSRPQPDTPREPASGGLDPGRKTLDKTGCLVLAVATFALTFGVNRAAAWGVSPLVIALIAAVPPLLWLLVVIERRATTPIVPLPLLRERDVVGASVASFMLSGAHLGSFLVTPLLLGGVFGLSVALTALLTICRTLSISLASPSASWFGTRFGPRPLAVAGSGAYVVSLVVLAAGAHLDNLAVVVAGLVVSGLAFGHAHPPLVVLVSNATPAERMGLAASLQQTSAQIGAVIGLSLLSALVADSDQAGPFTRAYLIAAALALLGGIGAAGCSSRARESASVHGSVPALRTAGRDG